MSTFTKEKEPRAIGKVIDRIMVIFEANNLDTSILREIKQSAEYRAPEVAIVDWTTLTFHMLSLVDEGVLPVKVSPTDPLWMRQLSALMQNTEVPNV